MPVAVGSIIKTSDITSSRTSFKKGLDKQPWEEVTQQQLPLHDNIRGADYYQ